MCASGWSPPAPREKGSCVRAQNKQPICGAEPGSRLHAASLLPGQLQPLPKRTFSSLRLLLRLTAARVRARERARVGDGQRPGLCSGGLGLFERLDVLPLYRLPLLLLRALPLLCAGGASAATGMGAPAAAELVPGAGLHSASRILIGDCRGAQHNPGCAALPELGSAGAPGSRRSCTPCHDMTGEAPSR